MSDEVGAETSDAETSARILTDLRTWRGRETAAKADWTARLTLREIDALLAIAAERDALRREACADPEPPRRIQITDAMCNAAALELFGVSAVYDRGRMLAALDVALNGERELEPLTHEEDDGADWSTLPRAPRFIRHAACGRTYEHPTHPLGRDSECDGTLDA